jgi:hypothetical protein
MAQDKLAAIQSAIEAAMRSGGLVAYVVLLEEGELAQRSLWLRPEVSNLVASNRLDVDQREVVKAALKRFVTGGLVTVMKADSRHREVSKLGDIKELQGIAPPFVELRFKPPKHDLRIFGRFIRKDGLILTSFGMKTLQGTTGTQRLSVQDERRRCDDFFKSRLDLNWVPSLIDDSLSNATFA